MSIRPGRLGDFAACLDIAASLRPYFTAAAITAIQDDLRRHQLYVAVDSGEVIGFMTVVHKSDRVSEISWMAVRPEYQGQGCGSALMEYVCAELKASGTRLLEVKTLAATVASPRYARTRKFYEQQGFYLLEEIDPYPGWDSGNPCAIYVKVL